MTRIVNRLPPPTTTRPNNPRPPPTARSPPAAALPRPAALETLDALETPDALETLPDGVLLHVAAMLRQRDLAALACVSSSMRRTAHAAMQLRDVLRVRQDRVADVAKRYGDARGLDVRGFPRRYGQAAMDAMGLLAPPAMPALARLELYHPRLAPGTPFWPTVFAGCPLLRHVLFTGDFFMPHYAADMRHVVDLMQHGAPVLESLDIEGGWMTIGRLNAASAADAHLAAMLHLVRHAPAVKSSTLRRLRHACHQVPMGVDAPVQHLHVDDQFDRPLVLGSRMGPTTLATVSTLRWHAHWPGFDAHALARMPALRDVHICVSSATTPRRMEACLATLSGLPAGLRRLTLDLDIWSMRAADSAIAWPASLAHLPGLVALEIRMLFAPHTVDSLLGGWLGAGPSVRTAVLRFRESAAGHIDSEIGRLCQEHQEYGCSGDPDDGGEMDRLAELLERASRPVPGDGLARWLDRRPAATADVHNLPTLLCAHPRCHVVVAPPHVTK